MREQAWTAACAGMTHNAHHSAKMLPEALLDAAGTAPCPARRQSCLLLAKPEALDVPIVGYQAGAKPGRSRRVLTHCLSQNASAVQADSS